MMWEDKTGVVEDLSATTVLYWSTTVLEGLALCYAVLFNMILCVALIPDVRSDIFHVVSTDLSSQRYIWSYLQTE